MREITEEITLCRLQNWTRSRKRLFAFGSHQVKHWPCWGGRGGGSPMEQSSTHFLHVKYNFFKKQNGKDWHLSILKLFHQQLIPFFGILKLYCCKCEEDHCLSQLYNQWHAFYLWEFNGFLWCFSAGLWQWGPDSQSALTRGRFLPLITPFIPKEGTRSTRSLLHTGALSFI